MDRGLGDELCSRTLLRIICKKILKTQFIAQMKGFSEGIHELLILVVPCALLSTVRHPQCVKV